jgi:uncharacterized protein
MLVKSSLSTRTSISDGKGKSPPFDHVLRAITLEDEDDVPFIKGEIINKTILVLRVTHLAHKNIEELRKVLEEIYESVKDSGGSIARLGDERVIITPDTVKIWNRTHTS